MTLLRAVLSGQYSNNADWERPQGAVRRRHFPESLVLFSLVSSRRRGVRRPPILLPGRPFPSPVASRGLLPSKTNTAPAIRKQSDPNRERYDVAHQNPARRCQPQAPTRRRRASLMLGSSARPPCRCRARCRRGRCSSKRSPMAIRIKPTFPYYRTPSRVSRNAGVFREHPYAHERPTAHRAAVGPHVGEEIVPGACRRLQAVPVQGELVHELVQGRIGVGDAPRLATTSTSQSSSSFMLFIASLRPGRW